MVAAERWDQTGRTDTSLLVRGRALRAAQRLARSTETFDELSLMFLAASAEGQQRRVRWTISALALTAITLGGFAWYANSKRIDAETSARAELEAKGVAQKAQTQAEADRDVAQKQRRLAEERRVVADWRRMAADASALLSGRASLLDRSALMAIESARLQPLLETDRVMRDTLRLLRKPTASYALGSREVTGIRFVGSEIVVEALPSPNRIRVSRHALPTALARLEDGSDCRVRSSWAFAPERGRVVSPGWH